MPQAYTKTQITERAKRKRNRLNMMGLRQPKGTRPRESRLPARPGYIPTYIGASPPLVLLSGLQAFLMPWRQRNQKRMRLDKPHNLK